MSLVVYGLLASLIAVLLYIWFKVLDKYGGKDS